MSDDYPPSSKNRQDDHDFTPTSRTPTRDDSSGDGGRQDRSLPVSWIIVIGMGLLLIGGYLFLQGFFTSLLGIGFGG